MRRRAREKRKGSGMKRKGEKKGKGTVYVEVRKAWNW
jgi:hypothetical protein